MARKPKPKLSQEEQSKRFLEAARELGVDEDVDLEAVVRRIAKRPSPEKKTKTFTASSEAAVKRQIAEWRRANPGAIIVRQHKPVIAKALSTSTPKQARQLVSILVDYVA
jgi:hypothetical protein